MKEKNQLFKQAVLQLIFLISAAAAIGLGTNHLRGDGIAVFGDWSALSLSSGAEDGKVISLHEAEDLFKTNSALFLDARPTSDFEAGHIQGALSFPWQNAESSYVAHAFFLDGKEHLICYCDGEACDLSHDLAIFLTDLGYTNVRVLINGWTVWRNAGLPIE